MKIKKGCLGCDGSDFKVIKRKTKKGGEAARVIECKKCKIRIGPSIIDPHFPSLEFATAVKDRYKKELMASPAVSGVGISKSSRGEYVIKVFLREDSEEIKEKYRKLETVNVEFSVVGDIAAT